MEGYGTYFYTRSTLYANNLKLPKVKAIDIDDAEGCIVVVNWDDMGSERGTVSVENTSLGLLT